MSPTLSLFSFGHRFDSSAGLLLLAPLGLRLGGEKEGPRASRAQAMARHWIPSSHGKLPEISLRGLH